MTDFTDREIVEAASSGRLRRGDWGTALLEPGGAQTYGPATKISAERMAKLRPLMQLNGRLYALTAAGLAMLKEDGT